jgi:hypothetical protein
MAYAEFFESLCPSTAEHQMRLWGRQMVLGPTPEFCLHSADPARLPESLAGRAIAMRVVGPE